MINGAVYIRVSTEDQTEFSPDAQLKAIKSYAKQNGIILVNEYIYVDEGISGRKAEKRPAFMRMISTAKLKPKPFDVILVHKFDRFARSREDSVVYKSLLRKECDVKVISITESIEDDKFSVILEAMLEAMAEYYSLNLAEEVRKGMTEKAERGGLQCSASFGYNVVNNMLVINEAEAKIVRLIFSKIANREMGMRDLAVYINELGVKTKRGNLFENRTIAYMLRNPVYIGKLRWTTEKTPNAYRYRDNPDAIIRDGGHEHIIDVDTWNKVQEVLSENKEIYSYKHKETTEIKTWLKGLAYCGNCGKSLIKSGYNALQCAGYARGKCKISCCITINGIENLVLEQLKTTFVDKIQIDIVPKKTNDTANVEFETLEDLLKKLVSREIRIKEAFQDGIDTLEEYKDNKQNIEDERKRTIQRLQELKAELIETSNPEPIHKELENLYALLTDETVSLENKYKAAHYVISKITYTKQEKTLKIVYK